MRIKADFVTNSSSTSYFIIPESKEQFIKVKLIIKSVTSRSHIVTYPKVFKTLKQLIEYIQDDKYTWIEGITNSPYRFSLLNEDQFEKCRWFLEQRVPILYAYVPNENEANFVKKLRKIQLDSNTFIIDDVFVIPQTQTKWKEYLVKKRKEYRKQYGYDDE